MGAVCLLLTVLLSFSSEANLANPIFGWFKMLIAIAPYI
jgi:hypothetical protein